MCFILTLLYIFMIVFIKCIECKIKPATIRCYDCKNYSGTLSKFCYTCDSKIHSKESNSSHKKEIIPYNGITLFFSILEIVFISNTTLQLYLNRLNYYFFYHHFFSLLFPQKCIKNTKRLTHKF